MVAFAGVTAMETSAGGVWTVSVAPLVTPARAAEIVVLPAETAVARPLVLMVATAGFDDVQAAWLVRFCVLVSE